MRGKFLKISPICKNVRGGGSLDVQLCGANMDYVSVKRAHSVDGTRITVDSGAMPKADEAKLSLFFPEGNRSAIYGEGRYVEFFIPFQNGVRYANLVIQNTHSEIKYARSILLHPNNPIYFDSTLVSSGIFVSECEVWSNDQEIRMRIEMTDTKGVSSILQSETRSIDLKIVEEKLGAIAITFSKVQELELGIWMLCVVDRYQKFIAQVCFESVKE